MAELHHPFEAAMVARLDKLIATVERIEKSLGTNSKTTGKTPKDIRGRSKVSRSPRG